MPKRGSVGGGRLLENARFRPALSGLVEVLFRLADISADNALQLFLRELSGHPVAGLRLRSEEVVLRSRSGLTVAHVDFPVEFTTQDQNEAVGTRRSREAAFGNAETSSTGFAEWHRQSAVENE